MKCPNCNETLVMTERQQVEIDYCPQCRGVWLDRGELDKIIERAGAAEQSTFQQPENENKKRRKQVEEEEDDDDNGFFGRRRGKGDGGFLGNLFDF